MPSESETRTKIINLRLKDAGWDVLDRTQVIEEFFTAPQASSQGADSMVREESFPYGVREFSDYVLLGKNGKALAVVEAKRSSKDAAVWREQAKQYCYHIQKQKRQRGCNLTLKRQRGCNLTLDIS